MTAAGLSILHAASMKNSHHQLPLRAHLAFRDTSRAFPILHIKVAWLVFVLSLPVWPASASPEANSESARNSDGVVVHRNADGSIETFDYDDPRGASVSQFTGRQMSVPSSNPYVRRHTGGVVVRRNADGSIETFDADDPRVGGAGAAATTYRPRHAAANKAPGSRRRTPAARRAQALRPPVTTRRSPGEVVVRRNADGSIESFDYDDPRLRN